MLVSKFFSHCASLTPTPSSLCSTPHACLVSAHSLHRLVSGPQCQQVTLGVWPALPIAVWDGYFRKPQMEDVDNIVAALEHYDCIYDINVILDSNAFLAGHVAILMHVPFPTLKNLSMATYIGMVPASVLPDSFLGGSAPRLQSFYLCGIPFLGLPKLLLTTTDLVKLTLWRIPHNRYISPSAMVTCLSSLIRLPSLTLGFRSPLSCPDRGH